MNQQKIGIFLKELRREKGLTQEQLAERLNLSNRTVSRWETGNSIPDLSILIELADFYDVDMREIVEGERKSEIKEENLKETLLKVSEYSDFEKKNKARKLNILFATGLIFILVGTVNTQFDILYEIVKNNDIRQGIAGAIYGLGIAFEVVAFYSNSHDILLRQKKKDILKRLGEKHN
jgi:transcriptional regulator with XRE-family HTH domain